MFDPTRGELFGPDDPGGEAEVAGRGGGAEAGAVDPGASAPGDVELAARGGLEPACQKSYSQPVAASITAMWPSLPEAAWAPAGMWTVLPSIGQVPHGSVQWIV